MFILLVSEYKHRPDFPFKEIKRFKHALQKKTFDLALDFQGNTKSALILSLAKASVKRSFHSSQVAEWPHRLVKAERIMSDTSHVLNFNRSLVEDLVQDKAWDIPILKKQEEVTLPQDRKIIMLGLGSMWPSKTFSEDQVQSLLNNLKNIYNPYFLIPALVSEKDRYLKLLGAFEGEILTKDNLASYIPYLLKTDLFIGVDSSLLHLARLFKISSKAFFGPSSLKFYGSSNDIQGSCLYGETFLKRCKNLRSCSAPCMKSHDLS